MYRFIRISALACVMLCIASCKAGLSDPPVSLDGNLSDPAGLPAVFIGASIIQYWQSYTDFPAQQWIDMGIAGQKCADVLARVQSDVIAKQPATMHLLCGTNDILHGPTDPAITEGEISQILFIARANNIDVIMATLPPVRAGVSSTFDPTTAQQIIALNEWIRTYAKQHRYPLADYYAALVDSDGQYVAAYTIDGIHPSAKGYEVMKSVIQPLFKH